MCYAISASPDPLARTIAMNSCAAVPDYPRPAVWPDGYYVPTSTGDDVIRSTRCAVDRRSHAARGTRDEQCMVFSMAVESVLFRQHSRHRRHTLLVARFPSSMRRDRRADVCF